MGKMPLIHTAIKIIKLHIFHLTLEMRALKEIHSGVKVILANVKYRRNLIDYIKKQNGYDIQNLN